MPLVFEIENPTDTTIQVPRYADGVWPRGTVLFIEPFELSAEEISRLEDFGCIVTLQL